MDTIKNASQPTGAKLLERIFCCVFALGVAVIAARGVSKAACVEGNASYTDISRIVIAQTGCGNLNAPGNPTRIACSRFWLEATPADSTYSQFNLQNQVGTYRVASIFSKVRLMLQDRDFFLMQPPDQTEKMPTEQTSRTITVYYCSVIRIVRTYNWNGGDVVTEQLFRSLTMLIEDSPKKQIAVGPEKISDDFLW